MEASPPHITDLDAADGLSSSIILQLLRAGPCCSIVACYKLRRSPNLYMLNLTSLVLYICIYTTVDIMAEFIDSEYHTQSSSIVDPGQDLELEPINAFYLQVPDNVS